MSETYFDEECGIEFEFDVSWDGDSPGWDVEFVRAVLVEPFDAVAEKVLTTVQVMRAILHPQRVIVVGEGLESLSTGYAQSCIQDRLRGQRPEDYYYEG